MLHILVTPPYSKTPWWPTTKRLRNSWGKRIWTDCCGCKMPSTQTDCQYVSYFDYPLGGDLGGEFVWGGDWEANEVTTGAWYGGDWKVRCAEGFGCTVNPRKKNGRELREMWRWGP